MNTNPLTVVAAIIYSTDGRLLIARKRAGKSMAGFWEFPGGKVEENEDPESAVLREIKEELGLEISINALYSDYLFHYPTRSIHFIFFKCQHISGEPVLQDHDRVEWVKVHELTAYRFSPGDEPVVKSLQENQ